MYFPKDFRMCLMKELLAHMKNCEYYHVSEFSGYFKGL